MPEYTGDKNGLEQFLASLGSHFYVYVLRRPDGTPFYVGKGKKRRVFCHEQEALQDHPTGESNPFKCNVIRKILRSGGQIIYEIDSVFTPDDEGRSFAREAELIVNWRRLHEGGTLANLAGGEGNRSGAAPFSLERHQATLSGIPENNPERATLNRFLQGIGSVKSIPIKPVSQIGRILPSTPHPQPRKPSLRMTYPLIASALANGLNFSKPCSVPRAFVYEGVCAIIENGVLRDILKAGMAELVKAFSLSLTQINLVADLYGRSELDKRGLL